MSILEPTKIAYRKNISSIRLSSSILLDNFNINSFYYHKIYDSGRFFLFEGGDISLTEYFEEKNVIFQYPLYCHPKYRQGGTQLKRFVDDPSLKNAEAMRDGFIKFGFGSCLKLINKTDNFVEEFGFDSAHSNESQSRLFINHTPELRLFARWFLEKNAHVISFLEESHLDLPSIIGADFYRDRIQGANKKKKKFFQDLGIHTVPELSEEEVKTIKLLLKGYTAPQIGAQLYRSERTIEHRIERIRAKWVCSSKAELIQKAQEFVLRTGMTNAF